MESEETKVTREILTSSPINTASKNCLDFDSSIYASSLSTTDNFVNVLPAVNNISSNNKFYDFNNTGDNNWAYDLSRNSLENSLTATRSDQHNYNTNFRSHHFGTYYNTTMKGNLMTFAQYQQLSPPSSSSSSSSNDAFCYGQYDNNNSSFININEYASHPQSYVDDFSEIFKDENYSIAEDAGHYTTLTNAATTGTPNLFDMYAHDIPRNYGHQHSTSSGGDSRSPDVFTAGDDYENGMQNFTQLTSLTSRSNGLYPPSPVNINDAMLSNYDSTVHTLTPNR